MSKIQYFLGGNTPSGFYSLYHQLSDPEQFQTLYIIKSGPGSGKSSLMRRVGRHAQAAGLETVEVLCSGDPDSLDALILPRLGAAIVDGTSPHVIEPQCTGVVDRYIDLSGFYDRAGPFPGFFSSRPMMPAARLASFCCTDSVASSSFMSRRSSPAAPRQRYTRL